MSEEDRCEVFKLLLLRIIPHVERWVANLDYEYEAEEWLRDAKRILNV